MQNDENMCPPAQKSEKMEKQVNNMMLPELRTACRARGVKYVFCDHISPIHTVGADWVSTHDIYLLQIDAYNLLQMCLLDIYPPPRVISFLICSSSHSPAGNKNALAERLIQAIYDGAEPLPVSRAEADRTAGIKKIENNYNRPDGQNTGNFITDRPSSRVIHNPGGGSSICLGEVDDEPKKSMSELKQKDIAGSGIFETEQEAKPEQTSPMSYSRQKSVAAAAGSDIFAIDDSDQPRNVVGGVRKPPGGGSSIVF